jgi:hypothetical protein
VLLFLKQKDIASHGHSANGFAVASSRNNGLVWRIKCDFGKDLRVWERETLVVSEIRTVVSPLPPSYGARNLGNDICGALVRAHHVTSTGAPVLCRGSALYAYGDALKRMLRDAPLVAVQTTVVSGGCHPGPDVKRCVEEGDWETLRRPWCQIIRGSVTMMTTDI